MESLVAGDVGFAYLDRARTDEFFARLKADAIEALAIQPGHRVLDVGCGTGEDAVAMSAAATDVFALGLDLSSRNIVEAKRRHQRSDVAFVVGDGHALPIATGSMDGCRAERTLQHVANPALVVAEIARTLRPGSRVVFSEPNWASCSLAGASDAVSVPVLRQWIRGRNSNPSVGSNLPSLLVGAGLQPVGIRSEAVIYRSLDEAELAFPLRRAGDEANQNGTIGRNQVDTWIGDLADASVAGSFVFATPLFTAVGIKPT